jgi:hypothetical protein
LGLLGLAAATLPMSAVAQVWINEIMYHPASEDIREEYIELYNAGAGAVDLAGWQFSRGVRFTVPAVTIPAGGYLVVAADVDVFTSVHGPGLPVVGNWEGRLSNRAEDLELVDAFGVVVDRVAYADEGDWGVRRRGPLDRGHRGWVWDAAHDGGGMSAERISPLVTAPHAQNWGAGAVAGGTPGAPNSILQTNVAPFIGEVGHVPAVPTSQDPVLISAALHDDRGGAVTAVLHWRADGEAEFTAAAMFDDGAHDDGAAGDGVFAAAIPPQPNAAVVEFYVEASDPEGVARTWPAPAEDADGAPLGQVANALYQVDDSAYAGAQPLIKLILTPAERDELVAIGSAPSPEHDTDAQMNATVIIVDGTGTEVRYTAGVRNRGHGTRDRKPNNYRINFVSDRAWQGVIALNINGQYSHAQLLGSVMALRSGLVGADARPVQVRVNNANLGNNGPQTYGGVYVANEVINSDWAEHWFPDDASGNVYRANRDVSPPNFDYRGTNWTDYTNTYFKRSNESENDWADLIGMLEVMGENRTELFSVERASAVIDVEQWLLHLAVMAMFANGETGLNMGYNDDYSMYAGLQDPRFILMYYDLDSVLGQNSLSASTSIFRSTQPMTSEGTWRAMEFFLHRPEIEPIYYRTLQRLLETTFAAEAYDATVDQVLGDFVPEAARNNLKAWMEARRASVQSQIEPYLAANPAPPRAVVSGEPRSPTFATSAVLAVGGEGVTQYRYRLQGGAFGDVAPVESPILLGGLANSSTNQVWVIGAGTAGVWQAEADATPSAAWVVRTDWPAVRINEVLARNVGALDHAGVFPDAIELYNEGDQPADLSGLRVTDDPAAPDKFAFPAGTILEAGAHLVLYAHNPEGTPGWHTGFALNQDGEGVYLFDAPAGGRGLLDGVTFGLQLPDLSIGRLGTSAAFLLTQPTFGGLNLPQPTGPRGALRINEWLASEFAAAANDFFEIYNSNALPAAIGGCFLTDNPIGLPARSPIAPLSFIAGQGFRRFVADGDPGDGADHVAFRLAAEQGLIALLDEDLATIDLVSYGPQRTDVSEGRLPDGDARIAKLSVPTPGAPNQGVGACTVTRETQELVAFSDIWRYNQEENLDGTTWAGVGYEDTGWPAGAGLLYVESSALPAPKSTPLTLGRITYYFRTTFLMPVDPAGNELWLDLVLDDGAVLYLNGAELLRVGMDDGPVLYDTRASRSVGEASVESLVVPGGLLVPGENTLAVEVHQVGSGSSDIVWGMQLSASRSTTNCAGGGVVLHEAVAAGGDGAPDWVEIWNPTSSLVDLSGMGLTDDPTRPDRWVFADGTVLAGGEYLVVECDGDAPTAAGNTSFGLDAGGDAVYLYASPAADGVMVDSIPFGLQTRNFGVGRAPGSPGDWVLTLPTRAAENVAAGLGNPSALRINEWMAAPEAEDDWFELYNPGPQPVAAAGLTLSDDPARRDQSPLAPLSFLGPGEARRIWADHAPSRGADHAAFRLAADSGFIGLYWPTGGQIDAVLYGGQSPGVSQGRFPDGAAAVTAFPGTDSPGAPNYLPLADLVINEVLSHTDPPWEDAAEIHNTGATPVDISGWLLSNDGALLQKFVVPSNTVVAAGAYRVFYEGDFGDAASPPALVPFRFDAAHGDEVHLAQMDETGNPTGYRASARFGAAANGESFGRFQTSVGPEFVAMSAPSFGIDNPTSVAHFRTGAGDPNPEPRVGPVILSEIHALPLTGHDGDANTGEFVELQNISGGDVPLFDPGAPSNTWRLAGGIAFTFPPGVTLAAGETAVVAAFDPATNPAARDWFRAAYGVSGDALLFGPFDGNLANEGEAIALYRPDPPQSAGDPDAGFVPQILVERVRWVPVAPWPVLQAGASLQRRVPTGFGNEPLHWFVAAPSAHRDNLADTDGDGLPDYWETAYSLDPADTNGVHGAHGDPDGDGHSNRDEYRAGTNPGDTADVLRILSVEQVGATWVLRFRIAAGREVQVRSSDTLIDGPWHPLAAPPLSANDREAEIPDPQFGVGAHRYYRLVVPEETTP